MNYNVQGQAVHVTKSYTWRAKREYAHSLFGYLHLKNQIHLEFT